MKLSSNNLLPWENQVVPAAKASNVMGHLAMRETLKLLSLLNDHISGLVDVQFGVSLNYKIKGNIPSSQEGQDSGPSMLLLMVKNVLQQTWTKRKVELSSCLCLTSCNEREIQFGKSGQKIK